MPKTLWNSTQQTSLLPKRFCYEVEVAPKKASAQAPEKSSKLDALKSKLTGLKGRMERLKLKSYEDKLQSKLEKKETLSQLDKDFLLYRLLDKMVDYPAKPGEQIGQWFAKPEMAAFKAFLKGRHSEYPSIVGRNWEQLQQDAIQVKIIIKNIELGKVPEKVSADAVKPESKPAAKPETKTDDDKPTALKRLGAFAGKTTEKVTKWVSKVTKGKVDLGKGVEWVKNNKLETFALVAGAVGVMAFLTRWRSMSSKGKLAATGSIATLGIAIAGKRIGKERIGGWFKKNLGIDMDTEKLKKLTKVVTTGKLTDISKVLSGEKEADSATKEKLKTLASKVGAKPATKAEATPKAPEKAPEKASRAALKSTVLMPSAPSEANTYIRFKVPADDATWRVKGDGSEVMVQGKDGVFKTPDTEPQFELIQFLKGSEFRQAKMVSLLDGASDADFRAKLPRVLITLQQKEIINQQQPENIPKVIEESLPALIELNRVSGAAGNKQKIRKNLIDNPDQVLQTIRKFIKKETKAEGKNK